MSTFLKRVAGERLSGGRPSPVRAMVAAAVAGAAAATLTYRALRA
jgi:hypothetical protein